MIKRSVTQMCKIEPLIDKVWSLFIIFRNINISDHVASHVYVIVIDCFLTTQQRQTYLRYGVLVFFQKKKKGALDFFVIINPCILWTSLNIKMSAVCKFPSHKNLEKVSVTMKMTKSPLFSYLNIVNCSTNWLKWTLLNWTDEKMKKKKVKNLVNSD